MSHLITWESWALSEEADRRFRRVVAIVAIPAILLALLFTFWELAEVKTPPPEYNGTQTVSLLAEQQPPAGEVAPPEQAKPAQEKHQEKKQEAPKREVVKPQPVQPPQPTAKEKAQKEINKAFDQLNDLRDQNLNALDNQVLTNTPTLSSHGGVGGGSAESIANSAAANSGGGLGGGGSYTSTQGGTGLGNRQTGVVSSRIGGGSPHIGNNGKVDQGRSMSEINEVFDRNKGGFTAIFNREQRQNADLGAGEIVVHLVIAPDGSVTSCSLVSSSYNNPSFEEKILARVRMLNFGSKSVPPFDVAHYPIHIQPM
jgi:outer membrane biosynthesis protein TonB